MKRIALFLMGIAMSTGFATAGVLVPGLDDATAVASYTSARAGVVGELPDITGGEITFAARFCPDAVSMTGGPVIVIEDGGTTFGSGLYMADGNLIFVSKNGNSSAVPESLNDLDLGNMAIAVTLGAINTGVENVVYASYDINNSMLYASVNGVDSSYALTSVPAVNGVNPDGNHSASFLGLGELVVTPDSRGSLGGLCEVDTNPILSSNYATNMVQVEGYDNQMGQIFGSAVPEPTTISLLALGALALKRRK